MRKTILLTITIISLIALSGCTKDNVSEDEIVEIITDDTPKVTKEMPSETAETPAPADTMKADTGMFEEYSETKFAELKGSAPVALFFHADWCSTCLGIEKEIEGNLAMLPAGTTILQVNYDKETALKKEYGVTMQSVLVFLDDHGHEISRLQGESTFDQIKEALMASA